MVPSNIILTASPYLHYNFSLVSFRYLLLITQTLAKSRQFAFHQKLGENRFRLPTCIDFMKETVQYYGCSLIHLSLRIMVAMWNSFTRHNHTKV